MKDPKGRKVIGFDKHVFVCENERVKGHPRECCSKKTEIDLKLLFKKELEILLGFKESLLIKDIIR